MNDFSHPERPSLLRVGGPIGLTLATAVAVSLLGACASGGRTGPSSAPQSEYRATPSRLAAGDTSEKLLPLEPGDAIEVNFSRESDRSGTYRVDGSGNVGLPFIGTRHVTDVAPEVLRSDLEEEYGAQLRNQTIEIRLLRRVRVLGQVNDPGLYHIDATMTLADVVAEAGGITNRGKLEAIRILRGGEVTMTDLNRATPAFATLRSGDQVLVPEKSWFARNTGSVIGASVSFVGIVVSALVF